MVEIIQKIHVLCLLLFLCLTSNLSSSAAAKELRITNCGGLLSSSPSFNLAVRKILNVDLSPISQQALLPKAMLVVDNDILTTLDYEAISLSLKNENKETTFYKALDSQGNVIAKTDVIVGEERAISSGDLFFSLLEQLDRLGFDRSKNAVTKIRSSHTHPPGSGSNRFSFADTNSLLVRHAILEMTGGNEIELEESILYLDIGLAEALKVLLENKVNGVPFSKKTLRIPSNSLSLRRGDYSIGASLDATSLKAIAHRPEKSTYSRGNW